MTPPYLTPRLHRLPDAAEPAVSPVALEVRLGTGRPVRYELEGAEFTIGAAADCDVRLPGVDTPPRVCSVARTADALYARRLDPAFPVLWNDRFLALDTPTRLGHGDRVAVGPLDVTVHLAGVYLHPDLGTPGPAPAADVRPPRPDPHAPTPRPEPPPTYGPDATAQLAELAQAREQLRRDRDELAAQARELESDRVLWYRRRQEMEAEAARPAVPGQAEGLAAREAELERFREELARLREQLVAQYQERRDELTRRDAAVAERQREQDRRAADTDEKAERLARDTQEFREQLDLAAAGQGRLADDAGRHDARAAELDALGVSLAARSAELDARQAALAEADAARETFQEQLRRHAEELAAHGKSLGDAWQRLTAERAELDGERERLAGLMAANSGELSIQAGELQRQATELAARGADLERQSGRLREVGKLVAGQKRELAGERQAWHADRDREATTRAEFEAFHARATAELQVLHRESPALLDRARQALDRLASARDALRGQLEELHSQAAQSRDALRAEAVNLAEREQALEVARAEHRLAVTEFRQQLLEWQARLADARSHVARGESAAESRLPEVASAARPVDEPTPDLVERRGEVGVHLDDLREWYRRKLKGLVAGRTGELDGGATILSLPSRDPHDDPEPGDRQLGERLRSLDLVDADTLTTLWAEARRQRRTLRTVLLAGGAVTLYQLAVMEAGNLGSLTLGRLRVLDRLRVTPREVVYRVLDPERVSGPTRGVFTLRHLAEAEMDDAVRPDEFRQRFTAARDAAHPNLAGTVEVLELYGRPAALLDFVPGLPASDWPAEAATPGAWVKLVLEAARGLDAAHRHGLTHGRVSSESFVLTAAGEVKVVGVGEPMWLATGVAAALDPTPEADLRALGQVAYGWSQLGQPGGKRRARGKGFPESLGAVVRRLEADPETPMADTASGAVPYRTAADLVHDLTRLAAIFPCPPEAHAGLIAAVAESLGPVRQSA